jgi:type III pantothenate kinase
MLLVVDVGNTNTVLGVYDEAGELRAHWRIETKKNRTDDEYAVLLAGLFDLVGLKLAAITAGIVSSVVPSVLFPMEQLFRRYLKQPPLVVGPGIKTGMPILYENPREVGADRIVNAVAAFERFKQGCIVVDFGTGTTFDVVTQRGEYLGGVIAPGLTVSADALYHAAAKLPRVELARPKTAIGKNTIASIQAGLVFGYAGLVDALIERIRRELDFEPRTLATGGLAPLIVKECTTIEVAEELLTLQGLKILFDRNRY